MKSKLTKAIENAEIKEIEADSALQMVMNFLTFRWFSDDDRPKFSMCAGGELILEYHGREIFRDEIIRLMERQGCVTPEDF